MKQILRSLVCEFCLPIVLPNDHVFMLNTYYALVSASSIGISQAGIWQPFYLRL